MSTSVIAEDATNVITAVADCPGESLRFCLSQVTVIGPFALVGFQLLVDIANVKDVPTPVFLTYTVLVTLVPGVIGPQSMDDRVVVQLLSEYMPMFGDVVIVPLVDMLLFIEIAP